MRSDDKVTVSETPTTIVLRPTTGNPTSGLLFQPGARVDARAYAGLMRPVAESGELVVIPKQPFGIGLLAGGALTAARQDHPAISSWVVAGHSLGGTQAARIANSPTKPGEAPVSGLLLYASYPATDMSQTLTVDVTSISGTNDGFATPDDIDASRANLPANTQFVAIDGGIHSFFGDYGQQPGDGTATISREQAQNEITAATLEFLAQRAVVR
jgi:pimeloyl-ACP methyl ester carboxylesterase